MDEEKLAEMLTGKPALAWKMRENGYFVVVDAKGKKIIFTPTQVEAVQNKPRARLAEASRSEPEMRLASAPMEGKEEEKPKRSYKPRTKKA